MATRVISFVGLWVLLFLYFSFFLQITPSSNNAFGMSDFMYYTMLVRAFWFEDLTTIYTLESNLKAISLHIPSDSMALAMPIGLTPISLITFLPFAALSFLSFSLSQSLFVALSISVFVNELLHFATEKYDGRARHANCFRAAAAACVLSYCFIIAASIGQTSILAISLLLLGLRTQEVSTQGSIFNPVRATILTLFLGVKLHYFGIFMSLLALFGRWKSFFFSGVLFVSLCLIVGFRLETSWLFDLLRNLGVFTSGNIPIHYQHAFGGNRINSFFVAFGDVLGTNFAASVPSAILAGTFIVVVGKQIYESFVQKERASSRSYSRLVLLIAAYLLLAPYVPVYEELLLIVVLLLRLAGAKGEIRKIEAYSLLCCSLLLLNHNALPWPKPIWALWLLKLIVLSSVYCSLRAKEKATTPRA